MPAMLKEKEAFSCKLSPGSFLAYKTLTCHSVSAVSVDVLLLRVDFAITPISWKDACHTVKVNFHTSGGGLSFRLPDKLRKRQSVSRTATTAVSSVVFSVPPSSQPTPAVHEAHKNIDISFQNTQILPPNFLGVDGATLHGPFV